MVRKIGEFVRFPTCEDSTQRVEWYALAPRMRDSAQLLVCDGNANIIVCKLISWRILTMIARHFDVCNAIRYEHAATRCADVCIAEVLAQVNLQQWTR